MNLAVNLAVDLAVNKVTNKCRAQTSNYRGAVDQKAGGRWRRKPKMRPPTLLEV